MKKEKRINWLKAATVRAMKTVAQTMIATIGTTTLFDQINWKVVLSSGLIAGLLSLLTSVAGLPELKEESERKTQ